MARRMYRYEVPIDDEAHAFMLSGDPVAVANGHYEMRVDFWAEHTDKAIQAAREFQVFGTGHALPDGARWVGTCLRTEDGLVWHLYEVTP